LFHEESETVNSKELQLGWLGLG